jgi:NAD(P)H-flavin reductase
MPTTADHGPRPAGDPERVRLAPAPSAVCPDWAEPEPWLVTSVDDEAPDVVTVGFAPPAPFGFEPGQFNMLSLPGVGEVPISVSSDPRQRTRVLHTIRAVGPVTRALCRLRAGERAGVRGPYGTSWPLAAAAGGDLVLVAGGIGLPPLRPALYQALRDRDSFGRITLLYGARTPADLLFPGEFDTWRHRGAVDVLVTVDAADRRWPGRVGVVPALIPGAGLSPETTAFVVGPEVMMRFTVRALRDAGIPDARIYLSMERNMQCAAALCGHCQFGPYLVCRDGPVFRYPDVARWLTLREL